MRTTEGAAAGMPRAVGCAIAGLLLAVMPDYAASAEPRAARGPVKVFLLAGQEGMSGYGVAGDLDKPAANQKATLVRFMKDPKNVEKYAYLYTGKEKDKDGWTVRDDVFVTSGEWPHDGSKGQRYVIPRRHGRLAPGYGIYIPAWRGRRGRSTPEERRFGPELGIGHVLGNDLDETVLLVKLAYNTSSLAVDFRPPGSGGTVGPRYQAIVKGVRDAMAHLPELVPGYDKAQGYEIAGLFWNQGSYDMEYQHAIKYETNLANLIGDLRRDLDAPRMKVVVATTGYGGWKQSPSTHPVYGKVIEAQLAVPKRPEFRGNVVAVETRDFHRDRAEFGGRDFAAAWWANGESHWLIGEAMGRAMLDLLKHAGQ